MAQPNTQLYFEDLAVGETVEAGSHLVTAAEIRDFGEAFDPQPYHVDEERAAETVFGELVASGWHTASICMGLFVENELADVAVAGGRGVDEVRWHSPVTPGDELSIEATVVEKRPSAALPGLGDLLTEIQGFDGDGERLVSFRLWGLVEARAPE